MNPKVEEMTITRIIAGQRAGDFTSEDLVLEYMGRIARFDKSGPSWNSVLELNPDAPAIAASLDEKRRSGVSLGPLHGVPVLVKDNIDTGDRMHTSAGSIALANSSAKDDAFLVSRLRSAGAVILGKANMTEWANFMTQGMPNGYSSRGGQVLNPYGPALDAGGSSTGSAVATATNLCTCAIGTETSGSILSPAVNNMVVGIKPTVGLVSRSGIIPISHSQDTAGPIARTVADAAALLSVIRGVDPRDPATAAAGAAMDAAYEVDPENGLKGLRVGVPRGGFWERISDSERAETERVLDVIRNCGASLVDPASLTETAFELSMDVLLHEFKRGINAYLGGLAAGVPVHSLAELIRFNRDHRRQALRYGQSMLTRSERFTSGTLTEPAYIDARREDIRRCRVGGINAAMAKDRLDVLVFPAYYGCAVAARAGYPSISIPTGLVSGPGSAKPFGVTFTGMAFAEAILVRAASALEHALGGRVPPDYV